MTGIDSGLIEIQNEKLVFSLFLIPTIFGAAGSLAGWAIKTIAAVSAPHYALIAGITCAATPIILYAFVHIGLKVNMQHYKIRLLMAAALTVFNVALITVCVAKGIFAAPFMPILATTFAAVMVGIQLDCAWRLYQSGKKAATLPAT